MMVLKMEPLGRVSPLALQRLKSRQISETEIQFTMKVQEKFSYNLKQSGN